MATILEVGRALARLIKDGTLPKPARTIRFLWVPEISGSTAYMFKHPELQDKLLVAAELRHDRREPEDDRHATSG